MGALDNEELLKRLDWADRKNVVKRMNMGPIGQFLAKLGEIGVPPQMMEVFQEIGQMDDKDFEKAMRYEEIPPFQALLQNPEEGEVDPAQQMDLGVKQADIEKTQAEVQKTYWDIELIKAKVETELVDQQVKTAGVNFDQEQLKIKRAELMAELEQQRHSQTMDRAGFVSGLADKADKSDLERKKVDTSEKIETKKVDVAEKAATQKAQSKGTAPYREKGMKSNNQKPGNK